MTSTNSATVTAPESRSANVGQALPTVAPITPSQLAIIKATVPVLQAHGDTITTVMYSNMIKAHPDLQNVFSHTSQITGAQPRALARAVLAYAMYIDDLPKLSHAIERIAQKHVSLFIKPDQYDIVATYLIGAIGEVLGDAATPEIVDAWTAAYGVLASVFIQREADLYMAGENWTGWRKFRIAKKIQEATDIASFYLEPMDGIVPLPKFLPGQYVSLQILVPQLGHLQSRQYSLSCWPGDSAKEYRVSVKKERDDTVKVDGMVSNLLHESYHEGDIVELSHPHGEFFLDPSDISKTGAPVVLLSAGVGATPMVSMLQALSQPLAVDKPISWIHTSRSKAAQPFSHEVMELVEKSTTKKIASCVHLTQELNEARPRLDISILDQEQTLFIHDHRTEYYICGPEKFMLDLRDKLMDLGVEKTRIFLELFATGDVD